MYSFTSLCIYYNQHTKISTLHTAVIIDLIIFLLSKRIVSLETLALTHFNHLTHSGKLYPNSIPLFLNVDRLLIGNGLQTIFQTYARTHTHLTYSHASRRHITSLLRQW
jgi:hypothetical protein